MIGLEVGVGLRVGIVLSPYSTGNGVRVGYPTRMKSTQKKEMYMASARNLRLVPNVTYIPLTRVGLGVGLGLGVGIGLGVGVGIGIGVGMGIGLSVGIMIGLGNGL